MKFEIFIPAVLLSACVLGCNGVSDPSHNNKEKTASPEVTAPKPLSAGQAIFEQKCTACHGSNGTSGIGNAANLQTSKLDSSTVLKVITEGRAGMPSFATQLTKNELTTLSSYVLSMRK